MTIGDALRQGTALLEQASVSAPRLTAEVLLMHAIGCERAWLFAHSTDALKELWWIHYGRYLHQRMEGKPTQQITGKQEFYGRDFRVTPAVLIPRPETEHAIEAALEHRGGRILDIGTGSGAIAITLVLETGAEVAATDISSEALKVAAANAAALGARVEFIESDLCAGLPDASFDLVVSNPPYIALTDKPTLAREVRDHEPGLALYGGDDGLEVYRRLIPQAARVLKPSGWLVLEIGAAQADAVGAMLGAWSEVEIRKDLAGLPRVVAARRP